MKQVNIYSETNIGLKRPENQDRVMTHCFGNDVNFAVICDGMGGENAGSEASQKAIEVIYERVCKIYNVNFDLNQTRNLLISAVTTANAVVYDLAISSSSMRGMGTTCVAVIQNKKNVSVISVGDSRAYIINDEEIKQITKDHTMVMQMYENGEITKEEMRNHPQKNYITRAVGVLPTVKPDYFELETDNNAVILLCSDGLTGCCDDDTILEVIKNSTENTIAGNLVNAALENGGNDNITVAVLR